MKNRSKFVGIIALAALIGFLGVSCDDGGTTTHVNHDTFFAPAPVQPYVAITDWATETERTAFFGQTITGVTLVCIEEADARQRDEVLSALFSATGLAIYTFTSAGNEVNLGRVTNQVASLAQTAPSALAATRLRLGPQPTAEVFNWGTFTLNTDQTARFVNAGIPVAAAGDRSGSVSLTVHGDPRDPASSGTYTLTTQGLRHRVLSPATSVAPNMRVKGVVEHSMARNLWWNADREGGTTNEGFTMVVGFIVSVPPPHAEIGAPGAPVWFRGVARINYAASYNIMVERSVIRGDLPTPNPDGTGTLSASHDQTGRIAPYRPGIPGVTDPQGPSPYWRRTAFADFNQVEFFRSADNVSVGRITAPQVIAPPVPCACDPSCACDPCNCWHLCTCS